MPNNNTPKDTTYGGGNKSPRPAKPSLDFPLFAHRDGQWAKKIKGRLRYFGPWGDSLAALQRYERQFGLQAETGVDSNSQDAAPGWEPIRRRAGNRRGPKPKKPYPTFPLTPLTNGQWGKKIRGEIKCFGPWRDPEGALNRFEARKG